MKKSTGKTAYHWMNPSCHTIWVNLRFLVDENIKYVKINEKSPPVLKLNKGVFWYQTFYYLNQSNKAYHLHKDKCSLKDKKSCDSIEIQTAESNLYL